MTDNVYCLVKIIERDERIIAVLQFEIKLFDFFLPADYTCTAIYCKLSECIGQTSCSYEHYLVVFNFSVACFFHNYLSHCYSIAWDRL